MGMKLTPAQFEYLQRQARIKLARESIWYYAQARAPQFFTEEKWFLKEIINTVQGMIERTLINENTGEPYSKLMINVPPQTGKCTSADYKLLTADGYKKARDVKIGDKVFSYDKGKLVLETITNKWDVKKKYYRIITRAGHKIEISPEHKMLTIDGYKEAKDITDDDFLIRLFTTELPKEVVKEIPEDELKFITYMLFDGCCRNNHYSFTKYDANVLDDLQKTASNLKIPHRMSETMLFFIKGKYSDYKARQLLQKYGIDDKLSKDKSLPSQFFTMPLKQKYLFLDLMFQTDGYAEKGHFSITLASEELLRDIHLLLLTMGIHATVYHKSIEHGKFEAWVLQIPRYFGKQILDNCNLGSKRANFEKYYYNGKEIREPRNLTYPYKVLNGLKNLHKTKLKHHRYKHKNLTLSNFQYAKEHYPELEKYEMQDFMYDKVASVEFVDEEIDMVDISVSNTENFILEGLVSHNSRSMSNALEWTLGKYPNERIIYTSYNDATAEKFSRYIRDTIMEVREDPLDQRILYPDIFPNTKIRATNKSVKRWALDGQHFNFLAAGVGGSVTSEGGSIIIVDDPVKNAAAAFNELELQRIWEWYTGTLLSRISAEAVDPIEIIIMTRWSKSDICGRLLDADIDKEWKVISYEAFGAYNYEQNKKFYPKEEFEAMDRYSRRMLSPKTFKYKRYDYLRKTMPDMIFRANYHQKPVNEDNLLYSKFNTYAYEDIKDMAFDRIRIKLDPAGNGSDYFVYAEYGEKVIGDTTCAFILDMFMSDDKYEIVIEEIAKRIGKSQASLCDIEGNRGGEAILDSLQDRIRMYGNPGIKFNVYAEKENKESKIKLMAHIVTQRIFMPEDWKIRFAPIYNHVTNYQRVGRNAHDDPEDVLSNIARDLLKSQGGFDNWIRSITTD
ncbi:MAG TPA: hypothetical protein ENG48_03295 [Candidatus Atribacteria bacterium]|nr:hypothetical protein [Candidatus Atribacteria bacterium]